MLKVLLLDRDAEFRRRMAEGWDLPDSEFHEAAPYHQPFALL